MQILFAAEFIFLPYYRMSMSSFIYEHAQFGTLVCLDRSFVHIHGQEQPPIHSSLDPFVLI